MCSIVPTAAAGRDKRTKAEGHRSTRNDTNFMEMVPATRFELVTP
jgi:hypothetical protein